MRPRRKESESIPKFGSFVPESICLPGFELGEVTSLGLYLDPCQSQMNPNPSFMPVPSLLLAEVSFKNLFSLWTFYALYMSKGKET